MDKANRIFWCRVLDKHLIVKLIIKINSKIKKKLQKINKKWIKKLISPKKIKFFLKNLAGSEKIKVGETHLNKIYKLKM